LEAKEVEERRLQGLDASAILASSAALTEAIKAIETGIFSPDEPHRFCAITHALQYSDYYMVLADFEAYAQTQRQIDRLWLSAADWRRTSILNIAGMAWFSSDRAIGEYASDIWRVPFSLPGQARGRVGT